MRTLLLLLLAEVASAGELPSQKDISLLQEVARAATRDDVAAQATGSRWFVAETSRHHRAGVDGAGAQRETAQDAMDLAR